MRPPPTASERAQELLGTLLPKERLVPFLAPSDFPACPAAAPASPEEAAEVLRLARAERWTLLPIGLGSRLSWLRPPPRLDLVLSSRNLRGISAYEPADGTLTAQAGTPWSELVSATAERHHLSPELAEGEGATLGGTIAAGASGLDRLRYGPVRHQILGLSALHADGSRVKSGGRVVKNVTGYDLHRLWCGSEGSLCFLLEATLRLYPAPSETVVLRSACADRSQALARCHALQRARLSPLAVVLRCAGTTVELAVVLAGRPEAVAGEVATAVASLGAAQTLRGEEARRARAELGELERAGGRWAPLAVSTRPSRLPAVLQELEGAARALGLAPELTLHPLLARAALEFPGTELTDERLTRLAETLQGAKFSVRWRGLGARTPPSRPTEEARELMRRLKRSLDPQGLFAGGPS
jgi:glycolate oxidase FAD binding subunit